VGSPIDVQRLREEILRWMSPPEGDRGGRVAGRQVRRLVEALDRPVGRDDLFLSSVAEAVLARALLEGGCRIDLERPTAGGRHADFHVRRGDAEFWVHVKRVGAAATGAGATAAAGPLPEELAELGAIRRPVAVAVRWHPQAGSADRAELRDALAPFIEQASVGDEILVRSEDGRWLGSARIASPAPSGHVSLRTGEDAGWEAAIPRVQRLLRKAYSQFMPGAANAICIVSDSRAAGEAVETALLGSVIERWDRFPPRGHRVAHGRADDGFWSRGRCEMSSVVAWLPVDGSSPARVWERAAPHAPDPRDAEAARVLREVLHAGDAP
jgi:hypothetical protein